jgi:hypothetical protein
MHHRRTRAALALVAAAATGFAPPTARLPRRAPVVAAAADGRALWRAAPSWPPAAYADHASLAAFFEGQDLCDACEVLSLDPPVVLLRGLASAADCAALTGAAEAKGFARSTVRSEQEDEPSTRTSSSAWLRADEHPAGTPCGDALRAIDDRVGAA